MTSYLRSIFGGSSSKSSESRSKSSHSRSQSVPTIQTSSRGRPAPPPSYVYTTVAPSSIPSNHSPTCPPTRPSPLRYNTYDATSAKNRSHGRSGSAGSASASGSSRSIPSGTVSYKSGDKCMFFPPFLIYHPFHSEPYANETFPILPFITRRKNGQISPIPFTRPRHLINLVHALTRSLRFTLRRHRVTTAIRVLVTKAIKVIIRLQRLLARQAQEALLLVLL